MSVVGAVTDEVAVMEGGRLIEQDLVGDVSSRPRSKGTQRFVAAMRPDLLRFPRVALSAEPSENANRTRGYDIVPLATSIITPLGIDSQKLYAIADLPDGAQLAIPNDPSNGARTLLLQSAGLITLRSGVDVSATVLDITGNPKHLKFLELDAAQLPRSLGDVAAAGGKRFALRPRVHDAPQG